MIMPKAKILVIVFFLYVGISVLATFPIVLHINSMVLGAPSSDIHSHLWDFWRVKTAILEDKIFPLRTDSINFPNGGLLFPASLLNAVASIPLQFFLDIEAAMNIIIILNMALGALGAFCLAYYLLNDIKASFISGVIYGFSPFILSFGVASGGTEIMSIAWLPLFFLFFIRTAVVKSYRDPLIASFFSLFILISCLYYAILAVFFVILFMLYLLIFVKDRKNDLSLSLSGPKDLKIKKIDRDLLARLAVLFLAILMLTLPFVIIIHNSLKARDSIIPREMVVHRMEGKFLSGFSPKVPAHPSRMAFLEDYLAIGKDKLAISHQVIELYQSVYCGYIVLFLVLLALFLLKRKFIYFWFVSLAVFITMSLGPYLAISRGFFLREPRSPIYLAIYYVMPLFKFAIMSNRFCVLVMLCLAVLAAAGCKIIISRLSKLQSRFLVAGLSGLIMVDFLLISPAQFPVPSTSIKLPVFYQELADKKDRFGILELPFFIRGTRMFPREHFSYQVIHRKAISDIVAGFLPKYIAENPFTRSLALLEKPNYSFYFSAGNLGLGDINRGFKELRRDNFRYVVVYKKYYEPDVWKKAERILRDFMGDPDIYPDGFQVYRIR